MWRGRRYRLITIAETGARFSDFTPYVASVDKDGFVCFQAALTGGGTGIFTGDGGQPVVAAGVRAGSAIDYYSHPDINANGEVSVYAELKAGGQGVFVSRAGGLRTLIDTGGVFARIGPLGPTMNDKGVVAFRADLKTGQSGVYLAQDGSFSTIADTSGFAGFEGLPVINKSGLVAFRADLKSGGQGIYTALGGVLRTIVETGESFSELGRFPCLNNKNTIVFAAILGNGTSGIFMATDCRTGSESASELGPGAVAVSAAAPVPEPVPVIDSTTSEFGSFRGALINGAGTVIFYATPKGGSLGIYTGPDAVADRLLGIGDSLFGSKVTDLALNPVSINEMDQVAIRIALQSGRQAIVRADPL